MEEVPFLEQSLSLIDYLLGGGCFLTRELFHWRGKVASVQLFSLDDSVLICVPFRFVGAYMFIMVLSSWALTPINIMYCPRFFLFLVNLWPHPRHMKVPRLGVKSELQLPAHTTDTAMPDLSRVYNLYHSSRQCQILNPLSKARDWTCVLIGY